MADQILRDEINHFFYRVKIFLHETNESENKINLSDFVKPSIEEIKEMEVKIMNNLK